MDLMFIDARVKLNGAYYREVLLTQKLLPIMREICGEFLVLQQGNIPAHRAREIPAFISSDLLPSNSTDLNPVHYKNMGINATAAIASS